MQRTIKLGSVDISPIWGDGSSSKKYAAEVTVELRDVGSSKLEFAATGRLYSGNNIIMAGQCLDDLNEFPELTGNKTFVKVYNLWKKHHLNSMHAGTPEQEKALKAAVVDGIIPSLSASCYSMHCDYLKSIGLYDVALPDGSSYRYGHGWLYEPIPDEDLAEIQNLLTYGK